MIGITPTVVALLMLGIVLATVFAVWLTLKVLPGRAREFSEKMQTCGYLPAPPTDRGQRWMMRIANFFVGWLVGPVEPVHVERLNLVDGKPNMICPDHPNMTDVVVVPFVIDRPARYMAALGVMQAFFGLGGLIVGKIGGFGADLRKGKGGPARDAAIEVLVTRQTLVMWPEGWTNMSATMGPFKKGAVTIAKAAAAKLGEPVFIVPLHLHYGRYPGTWIKSFRIDHQYWLTILLFPFFRKGVRPVFGTPISSADLPECDEEATAFLKSAIEDLKSEILASDAAGKRVLA